MQSWRSQLDWLDFAARHPLHLNFRQNGMRRPVYGLVVHITVGHPTFGELIAHWSHPNVPVSAHFAIRRNGELGQFVSLKDSAYHVGGDSHRNDDQYWYGVENVGNPSEGLSDEQISTCARLFHALSTAFSFPLSVASSREEHGLGYHSMFHRGTHLHCPGNLAVSQLPLITEAARALPGG